MAKETKPAVNPNAGKKAVNTKTPNRLRKRYMDEISPALMKSLGAANIMEVPRLEKIVISVCTSEAVQNPKILNQVVDEITAITGQKAVMTKSKKAISNFKLREGLAIGVRVTLRRDRMWAGSGTPGAANGCGRGLLRRRVRR